MHLRVLSVSEPLTMSNKCCALRCVAVMYSQSAQEICDGKSSSKISIDCYDLAVCVKRQSSFAIRICIIDLFYFKSHRLHAKSLYCNIIALFISFPCSLWSVNGIWVYHVNYINTIYALRYEIRCSFGYINSEYSSSSWTDPLQTFEATFTQSYWKPRICGFVR